MDANSQAEIKQDETSGLGAILPETEVIAIDLGPGSKQVVMVPAAEKDVTKKF